MSDDDWITNEADLPVMREPDPEPLVVECDNCGDLVTEGITHHCDVGGDVDISRPTDVGFLRLSGTWPTNSELADEIKDEMRRDADS